MNPGKHLHWSYEIWLHFFLFSDNEPLPYLSFSIHRDHQPLLSGHREIKHHEVHTQEQRPSSVKHVGEAVETVEQEFTLCIQERGFLSNNSDGSWATMETDGSIIEWWRRYLDNYTRLKFFHLSAQKWEGERNSFFHPTWVGTSGFSCSFHLLTCFYLPT